MGSVTPSLLQILHLLYFCIILHKDISICASLKKKKENSNLLFPYISRQFLLVTHMEIPVCEMNCELWGLQHIHSVCDTAKGSILVNIKSNNTFLSWAWAFSCAFPGRKINAPFAAVKVRPKRNKGEFLAVHQLMTVHPHREYGTTVFTTVKF